MGEGSDEEEDEKKMDGLGNVEDRIKIMKGEVKGNSDLKRSDFVLMFVQFGAFVSFNTLLPTVSLDLSFLHTQQMQGQSVGLISQKHFDLCRNQNAGVWPVLLGCIFYSLCPKMLFLVCEQLLRLLRFTVQWNDKEIR